MKTDIIPVSYTHLEVSATKGDGMDAWCDWLQTESAKCK